MKRILLFGLLFFALTLSFASLPTGEPTKPSIDARAAAGLIDANGKVDYKKLSAFATNLKGSKLTIKEKLGLKLFGKRIAKSFNKTGKADGQSQVLALILCFLVGTLGVHRFYLGYTWQGIVQLLTLGGCGIWTLIDFIRIITGSLTPKDGEYGTTL